MPIKSKAQRRKFAQLLIEGKISPETFEEWNRGAGGADLPERVHPKAVTNRKRKGASKPARTAKSARAAKARKTGRAKAR